MATFRFTKAILEGSPIDVYNHGNHKRDFTYVDDIVEGIVRLIDRRPAPNEAWSGDHPDPGTSRAPYRIYNIGNHSPVELRYLIELLEGALGRRARKNYLPLQPGDVPETFADITRAQERLGFQPVTPIDEGIPRFVKWYLTYHGLAKKV